ncbi:PEP-CTERM sorting domain-containing protein [Aestuariibacter halophilus]|uniref:PEP-CTERM sorting domain-containing protein n=1 Tax=Fluctibacter halophilus TaxID=226011 RepID=A0ABS8G8H7_9ALTE|nr:PEP-CTERM sorting domain-containing protein [Aestuariibacter halophilus]MCC2616882.1 PEP-CTERM sorting domain-containing protein [Aestuariibacter halophilus]
MKFVKHYFAALLLVLGTVSTAQATLITHDVLIDGTAYGEITIDTIDGVDDGFGFLSFDTFTSFTMFGRDMGFSVFDFEAIVDSTNLFAGIEFLAFDTESFDGYAFQGIFDAFAFDPALDNFIDIFDTFSGNPVVFGELSLSAPPAVVSEPGVAVLFMTALAGLFIRRRRA